MYKSTKHFSLKFAYDGTKCYPPSICLASPGACPLHWPRTCLWSTDYGSLAFLYCMLYSLSLTEGLSAIKEHLELELQMIANYIFALQQVFRPGAITLITFLL